MIENPKSLMNRNREYKKCKKISNKNNNKIDNYR